MGFIGQVAAKGVAEDVLAKMSELRDDEDRWDKLAVYVDGIRQDAERGWY